MREIYLLPTVADKDIRIRG